MGWDDVLAGVPDGQRDMSSNSVTPSMQPTPKPLSVAHCCACNEREMAEAMKRQRSDQEYQMRRDQANLFVTIIDAAVNCVDGLGEHSDAAKALLAEIFVGAAKTPTSALPDIRFS